MNDTLNFLTNKLDIQKFKLNVVKDSPDLLDKADCISPQEYAEPQIGLVNKLIALNKSGHQVPEFYIRDKLLNLLIRGKTNICVTQGCMGGFKLIGFDRARRHLPLRPDRISGILHRQHPGW